MKILDPPHQQQQGEPRRSVQDDGDGAESLEDVIELMADDALRSGDPLVKGMSMVYIHRQQVTNLRSITVGDHHPPIYFQANR